MRKSNWIGAVALVLSFLAGAASADEIPWDRIEGGDGLKGIFREAAAEVIESAECYGGCEGTILDCLRSGGDDKAALRLAAFVVRRVRADNDPEDILREIEERRQSAFPEKTHTPDLEGLVVSGDPKAPVRVVVYADFGCPYCKATATALRRLSGEEGGDIAFYFKNYPLKANDRAVPSALALLAADRQGKFWEMLDLLYQDGDDLSDEYIEQCAAEAGLDVDRFHSDLKSKELVTRLRAEKMEGLQLGVKKTPGILVNGKFYRGVRIWEELYDRIEEELEMVGAAD